jgi:PTH1 family peptidyl-tRNA hydrolase
VLKRREPRRGTPADLLVVGLGNPGAEYARSRHNVGADVVEMFADRHDARLKKAKERARTSEIRLGGRRVALAVPTTYMNDSGGALAALVRRYGVDPPQVVVVHDELDLPVGALRLKAGGGLAGHNGLRSIAAALGTDDFLRVRIGVDKPVTKERGADHVLNPFSRREREAIDTVEGLAIDALECIVTEGIGQAMNRFNRGAGADDEG